jgi:hypothetical protein
MTAPVDLAFKAIPKNSTAFLIWRIEVSDTVLDYSVIQFNSQRRREK